MREEKFGFPFSVLQEMVAGRGFVRRIVRLRLSLHNTAVRTRISAATKIIKHKTKFLFPAFSRLLALCCGLWICAALSIPYLPFNLFYFTIFIVIFIILTNSLTPWLMEPGG